MRRILVADPDVGVAELLDRALGAAGYEIAPALTFADAERLVREGSFDAALVDRGACGPLLDLLARLQPHCLRMLTTADADADALLGLLNDGDVMRVLAKPLEIGAVVATVEGAFAATIRMHAATTERLIESHRQERRWFEETLTGGLLRLALQPIVEVSDAAAPRVIAFEALLRSGHPAWSHPEPLLVVAERLGRVPELGARVFRLAADRMPLLPPGCGLFVNVHPLQLANPAVLLRDLRPLLPWARRITLEITERAHPLSVDAWDPIVQNLTGLGFSLAIDDLGAGSSGLLMLASLQPQVIKLDMTLVRGIADSARRRRLIQLLVAFAETTGANLMAEGVETEAEAAALQGCGVRTMQGYLFGRPALAASSS